MVREEDSNWFAKWDEELPSPEDLMPLSQTLITPHLALAFDIQNNPNTTPPRQQPQLQTPPTTTQPNSSSAEFETSSAAAAAVAAGSGGGGDEPARTLKRPRLVWTPQLHKRFVEAVAHLGIKNAVPKTIMQLMSVDGLTRENVASHLQKYRLYLKRMQGMNNGTNGVVGSNVSVNVVDPATDHLFASSPVPPHFLRPSSDHFMPYVPVTGLHPHPHTHTHSHPSPMAVVGRPFGNSTPNGQFDHAFLARQQVQRLGNNTGAEDFRESPNAANGRKVLTLFPTGEDHGC